ncbi:MULTISPECIES: ABC transporter ATP-binding protein [Streptomyces]|uniref:ABC transporter ATP-binding protein n=3 Tax=Streptomyces TaxID=1883 RepID=A0ABW0B3N0_9ACTN|nr:MULTISPECIES: ABC transporter ATP-binding protein [Streptomyces]KPC80823.1 multidrug ABC transporter ATPase [Streptomyces sp. NRRL S-4]
MSRSDDTPRLPVADGRTARRAGWQLLKDDPRAVCGMLLLTSLAALAGAAGPWLLGRIITRFEAGDLSVSQVDVLAAAVLAFAAAQLVLTRYARGLSHRFGERALARLREEVVDRALALPGRVADEVGTGDLVTRSTLDVATVSATLRNAAPDIFIACVQVVFIFAAVFLLDPLLGLCSMVGLPLVWVVSRWYLARSRDAYLAEGAAAGGVAEILNSTAHGARTVEAYGLRTQQNNALDQAINKTYGASTRTLSLRTVLFPVTEFAHTLPMALVLLVGGLRYLDGAIPLGTVVAGSLYMWQLVDPLNQMLIWVEQLQRSGASFARIKGVGLVSHTPDAPVPPPADDLIEVQGVRYSYLPDHEVLKDVELQVRPGERLAVVGRSGAGKSTLGKLMSGVDTPDTGSILVGGVPVADLAAAGELGNRIVLITQQHHVFMGTLRDNMMMAAPEADDEAILAALALMEADWVADLPQGLDTMLGSGGVELKAAQAQQLTLARVHLADPHTLILDEATSLLDPTTARQAERAVAAVRSDRTVIAIAHRLQTAHDADRVAVMESGRIVELGTHDELVGAGGAYAALWRSWNGEN